MVVRVMVGQYSLLLTTFMICPRDLRNKISVPDVSSRPFLRPMERFSSLLPFHPHSVMTHVKNRSFSGQMGGLVG